MTHWLEHTVQTEVEIPIDLAWQLWTDLEQMPKWMKWIESVKVVENDPSLSRWTLKAGGGFEFHWLLRITQLIKHQVIQSESVDGLPNRTTIQFCDRPNSTIVKLSVAYAIPGLLGKLMDNLFLGRVVESTLQADLNRFRDYALTVQANRISSRIP